MRLDLLGFLIDMRSGLVSRSVAFGVQLHGHHHVLIYLPLCSINKYLHLFSANECMLWKKSFKGFIFSLQLGNFCVQLPVFLFKIFNLVRLFESKLAKILYFNIYYLPLSPECYSLRYVIKQLLDLFPEFVMITRTRRFIVIRRMASVQFINFLY